MTRAKDDLHQVVPQRFDPLDTTVVIISGGFEMG
jgi:hypothetical protein